MGGVQPYGGMGFAELGGTLNDCVNSKWMLITAMAMQMLDGKFMEQGISMGDRGTVLTKGM